MAANGPEPITFFEITTAAAFLAFAETPADWTLLEVGLGGRLDATNVVERPRLTVITPVDLDHQQYLGETLAADRGREGGHPQARRPLRGRRPSTTEALAVIEARAARARRAAPRPRPALARGRWSAGGSSTRTSAGSSTCRCRRLRGPHQVVNAGTALAALRALGADDGGLRGGA